MIHVCRKTGTGRNTSNIALPQVRIADVNCALIGTNILRIYPRGKTFFQSVGDETIDCLIHLLRVRRMSSFPPRPLMDVYREALRTLEAEPGPLTPEKVELLRHIQRRIAEQEMAQRPIRNA